MSTLTLTSPPPSPEAERLRAEVREFLATELSTRSPRERAESWSGFDPEFSLKMGERGWIGMTWPKQYGGSERSAIERYVVLEETLAAGAPVSGHWVADRQSGPLLLRVGTEEQKQEILPRITRGDCYFCIGMSEPNSGSDLASVRTRAESVEGGFRINGTKLWTSNAHRSHYMILFCRTTPRSAVAADDRHGGMSQFLVDLRKTSGVDIRPIRNMADEDHFNEVVFEDCFLPNEALIGTLGGGWQQVTSELGLERSGPERFLSSFTLLVELTRALGPAPSDQAVMALGRLVSHVYTLRRMSRSVAGMLQTGANPAQQAALVKDLGTSFEQEVPEIARLLLEAEPTTDSTRNFIAVLAHTILHAPTYSIRGGTREILRGMIARGLGLR